MSSTIRTGECLCGSVKYRLEGNAAKPLYNTVCHCLNCRRATGTAFLSASICPKDGFAITEGEEALKTYKDKTTDSELPLTRAFCGECGSKLFAWTPLREDIVSVTAGTLDDFESWQPDKEQYCIHRAQYVERAKGVDKENRHVTSVQSEPEQT